MKETEYISDCCYEPLVPIYTDSALIADCPKCSKACMPKLRLKPQMKPSERIEEILKEKATSEWARDNSISNNYNTPEIYALYLRERGNVVLEIIKKYLDEKHI